MPDQYGGHYAPQQPQQYAAQPQYQQSQQQYDQYGDGYGYEQKPSARGGRKQGQKEYRNDFERLSAAVDGEDGQPSAVPSIVGWVAFSLAMFEVLFLPVEELWVQDIFCVVAISLGAYSYQKQKVREDGWQALVAIVLGACALVGTMGMHAMGAVIGAAIG